MSIVQGTLFYIVENYSEYVSQSSDTCMPSCSEQGKHTCKLSNLNIILHVMLQCDKYA